MRTRHKDVLQSRLLRILVKNPNGYDDNSPIHHIDKLNAPLLLIHGDRDDNVHVQNTMDFLSAAIKANKHFDLFIYPNENHKINKGKSREHVFEGIKQFLMEQSE